MAARSTALAKLTRPRLYDALPRPRLYSLLDDARARPIVWVAAPPGAGKTTLVASWLEARRLEHLWYQIDVGDADPATFVHYVRIAAQQLAGKAAAALPAFTSEPQQNLARFARGFFRDLFALLPQPCVVVFDNFHEARTPPEQRAALAQGLEEIPEGVNVVALSRAEPPPEFARLVANRKIARLDADALRCTENEAEAIFGRGAQDSDALARIQRQSDGWMAALVLLREHASRQLAPLDEALGEGKDAIFRYFAGEIFNGARPENQRVLMLTSMLPSVTAAEATALTGNEEAPQLLDYLYRRHLFIDRRRGAQTTFHYHALFREFLQSELAQRIAPAERRAAGMQAAALLAERGLVSDALSLYRDAGAWEPMRALIHANALDWAREGRAQALSDWIAALPAAMPAGDPWLEYWFGRAWIFVEPDRGRPALERAFDAFRAAGDVRGQALALNTIVTGYYYEWANFAPLDRWLPEFERLLGGAVALDRGSELRARAAWVIALLFRRPDDGNLDRCAERLDELIDGESDLNARMMAASTLFNYLNWKDKSERAAELVARIEPVVREPEVTPLMQVWWRTHLSFWHYIGGRYEASAATIKEARSIAERYGLEAYLFEIYHAEVLALVSTGDLAGARAVLERTERRMSPARRMDWAYFHYLRSTLEQRLGHFAAAVRDAEKAVAVGRETGLPRMQLPHFVARLAHARLAAGDREGGLRDLDAAIAASEAVDRRSFEQQRELFGIDADIGDGNTDRAAGRLAALLADYRARGAFVLMRSRPDLAARLADFALARDIEADFVHGIIERNALPAPPDAGPAWPFRLRVRVLGGFDLARDGVPVRWSGKAQQRPLDLLKLLVALGGDDVDGQQLTAALWPDADGAAAKTSFDTTLFRLRKLLDVEHALVLSAGKLTLDRALAWTDVRALDEALGAAERLAANAAPDALTAAARRLLDAYPGPLLGSEESPWIAKPRDALAARFVRTLTKLGGALEAARAFDAAADLYRRGLEADNLAEALYRGLMRSLAAKGHQAEALNAFRRCRELLSIVLGIRPSAETERLHREIATGGTAVGS